MKKPIIIVIGIVVALVFLGIAKNAIVKVSVEKGVEAVTGLPLSIGRLDVGIFKTLVGIRDMRLHNPKGFPDKVMLDMPEIYVDYNLGQIFRKKIHLNEVRVNLKEFAVIKDKDGNVNLDALRAIQKKDTKAAEPTDKKAAEMPEIQIDVFELKIGKAVFKDYSKDPNNPSVQEFPVNIDEKYENITNVQALASLIVFKAIGKTTIARLASIDLSGVQDAAAGAIDGAKEMAAKTGKAVGDAAEKASESVQKATEGLKGLFSTKE